MFNITLMGLSFRNKRRLVNLKNRFRKTKPKMGEVQKRAYNITIKVLHDNNSELIYAPNSSPRKSNKRIIKNGDIFVTVERNTLTVINGIYHYEVFIDDELFDYVVSKFNTRMESKSKKFQTEIKDKVTSRLEEIYKDIGNK